MLTLVEYPRNQVALVENSREAIRPRAKHIREAFAAGIRSFAKPVASLHQLLHNIIPH